eukprot:5537432-Pleurochrysis_carterae.AAC.2
MRGFEPSKPSLKVEVGHEESVVPPDDLVAQHLLQVFDDNRHALFVRCFAWRALVGHVRVRVVANEDRLLIRHRLGDILYARNLTIRVVSFVLVLVDFEDHEANVVVPGEIWAVTVTAGTQLGWDLKLPDLALAGDAEGSKVAVTANAIRVQNFGDLALRARTPDKVNVTFERVILAALVSRDAVRRGFLAARVGAVLARLC